MGEHRRTSIRLHGKAAAGAILAAAILAVPARADEAEEAAGPVVVEMFLSQACNMCPPAAALFHDIAARDDVIALSWHVDYWNMTTSEQGRWVDPYSDPAYTARQKRYNINIRNRSSVYTPQAIVQGEAQTVGSSLEKISSLIGSVSRLSADISARIEDGAVRFEIGESEEGGNAYLVTFRKSAVTDITAGKNAGKVFDEVNVVTGFDRLGIVRKRGGELTAPIPAQGEGCALIVQEPGQKRVIAAAYCPV